MMFKNIILPLSVTGIMSVDALNKSSRAADVLAPEVNKNYPSRVRRSNGMKVYTVNFFDDTSAEERKDFFDDFGEFVHNKFSDGSSFIHLQIPNDLYEDVVTDLRTKSFVHSVEHEIFIESSRAKSRISKKVRENDEEDVTGNPTFEGNGHGIHIFIVDTGIDDHPEFEGRIDRSLSRGFGERNSTDSYDCHGLSHGTKVAGIAAGKDTGVASAATLVSFAVMTCGIGGTFSSTIEESLKHLADNMDEGEIYGGLKVVVNLSNGPNSPTETSEALKSLETQITNQGGVIIRAAGNHGEDACIYGQRDLPNSITVGSTDKKDKLSKFSNHGKCVDLYAPGEKMLTTDYSPYGDYSTKYTKVTGTSFACPLVSGAAAIMFQQKGINAQGNEVKNDILTMATPDVVKNLPDSGDPNKFLFLQPATIDFDDMRFVPSLYQGMTAVCSGPVGIETTKPTIEDCHTYTLSQNKNGFNYYLDTRRCYPLDCGKFFHFETYLTTPGNKFTPGAWYSYLPLDSMPLLNEGFILDTTTGDFKYECVNGAATSFEAVGDLQSCVDLAVFSAANVFNYNSLSGDCEILGCDEAPITTPYQVTTEAPSGSWVQYKKNTFVAPKITSGTTNGSYRLVAVNLKRFLPESCSSTSQAGLKFDSVELCRDEADGNNSDAYQYSIGSQECVLFSCSDLLSVTDISLKTYSAKNIKESKYNDDLSYVKNTTLYPSAILNFKLLSGTAGFSNSQIKLDCSVFRKVDHMSVEDCAFYAGTVKANAFNFNLNGICEPLVCVANRKTIIDTNDDSWLMYIIDDPMETYVAKVTVYLKPDVTIAEYNTFKNSYLDVTTEARNDEIYDKKFGRFIMELKNIETIKDLKDNPLVEAVVQNGPEHFQMNVYENQVTHSTSPLKKVKKEKKKKKKPAKKASKNKSHKGQTNFDVDVMNGIYGATPEITSFGWRLLMGDFGLRFQTGDFGLRFLSGDFGLRFLMSDFGLRMMAGDFGLRTLNGDFGKRFLSGDFGKRFLSGDFGLRTMAGDFGQRFLSGDFKAELKAGEFGYEHPDLNYHLKYGDAHFDFTRTEHGHMEVFADTITGPESKAADFLYNGGEEDSHSENYPDVFFFGNNILRLFGDTGFPLITGCDNAIETYGDQRQLEITKLEKLPLELEMFDEVLTQYTGETDGSNWEFTDDVVGDDNLEGLTTTSLEWQEYVSGYNNLHIFDNLTALDTETDSQATAGYVIKRVFYGTPNKTSCDFIDVTAEYKGHVVSSDFKSGGSFVSLFNADITTCPDSAVNIVYGNMQYFTLVSDSENQVHITCSGSTEYVENVVSVKSCADLTAGESYNAFSYSPILKVCALQTCLDNIYESTLSAPGWIAYVASGYIPASKGGFSYVGIQNRGSLQCVVEDIKDIYASVESVERCIEIAEMTRSDANMINYFSSSKNCEMLTCFDNTFQWTGVATDDDRYAYTYILEEDRQHIPLELTVEVDYKDSEDKIGLISSMLSKGYVVTKALYGRALHVNDTCNHIDIVDGEACTLCSVDKLAQCKRKFQAHYPFIRNDTGCNVFNLCSGCTEDRKVVCNDYLILYPNSPFETPYVPPQPYTGPCKIQTDVTEAMQSSTDFSFESPCESEEPVLSVQYALMNREVMASSGDVETIDQTNTYLVFNIWVLENAQTTLTLNYDKQSAPQTTFDVFVGKNLDSFDMSNQIVYATEMGSISFTTDNWSLDPGMNKIYIKNYDNIDLQEVVINSDKMFFYEEANSDSIQWNEFVSINTNFVGSKAGLNVAHLADFSQNKPLEFVGKNDDPMHTTFQLLKPTADGVQDCVRWGDDVILSAKSNHDESADPTCGNYGCNVANSQLNFGKGTASNPLKILPVGAISRGHTCVRSFDRFKITEGGDVYSFLKVYRYRSLKWRDHVVINSDFVAGGQDTSGSKIAYTENYDSGVELKFTSKDVDSDNRNTFRLLPVPSLVNTTLEGCITWEDEFVLKLNNYIAGCNATISSYGCRMAVEADDKVTFVETETPTTFTLSPPTGLVRKGCIHAGEQAYIENGDYKLGLVSFQTIL